MRGNMKTETQPRIEDVMQEFHPQRCDVDIVVLARSYDDAHENKPGTGILARWDGHVWNNYGVHFGSSECFLVHEGQLFLTQPEGKVVDGQALDYKMVDAIDRKALFSRPFPIVASGKTGRNGTLTDLVRDRFKWVQFESKRNSLVAWKHDAEVPRRRITVTPTGYFASSQFKLGSLFGLESIKAPEGIHFGHVALANYNEHTNVKEFIARTHRADSGAHAHFVKISLSEAASDLQPHCVMRSEQQAAGKFYTVNRGKTLYIQTGVHQGIERVDLGDSVDAESREVLRMEKSHTIEHFSIYPHGMILPGKREGER